MQTDHLHFLLEIAHQGSINKAAEALHLPRTHLSRILANLEEQFGVTLFERLPRGVRPTIEGEYVLARTEEALTILDEMITHFHEQQQTVFPYYQDKITFYCPAHMRSRGLISHTIDRWQKQFPNAPLIQKMYHTDNLSDRLKHTPKSLALVLQMPEVNGINWQNDPALRFIPVNQSNIVALVAESHPLAQNKSISLKKLCNERLILISQDDEKPPAFYNLLAHYGTPNIKQIITGNTPLLQEMITSGCYVSIGIGSQRVHDGLLEIPLKEKIKVTGGLLFSPESMKTFPLYTFADMILTDNGLMNGKELLTSH
ncbi:MAG: LysR family transcriptional regulator [Peptococcaceae bacterium]|nr:LysR family transcriptional regulator [Peptococcaceae bacterium]